MCSIRSFIKGECVLWTYLSSVTFLSCVLTPEDCSSPENKVVINTINVINVVLLLLMLMLLLNHLISCVTSFQGVQAVGYHLLGWSRETGTRGKRGK